MIKSAVLKGPLMQ